MQCANCARTLPDNVSFCFSCGSPVTPTNASLTPGDALATGGTYPGGMAADLEQVKSADQEVANQVADFVFQEFGTPPRAWPLTGRVQPQPGAPIFAPPASAGTASYPFMPATPGVYPLPAAPSPKRRGRSVGCIVLYAFLAIVLLFTGLGIAIHEIGSHVLGNVETRSDTTKAAAMQLYQQVTSQQPTFQDTITDGAFSGWTAFERTNYGCTLDTTGLRAHIEEAGHFVYCTNNGYNFINIAFQIQIQFISGNAGGLVFRVASTADGSSKGFYLFQVTPAGSYTLDLDKDVAAAKFSVLATGITQAMNLPGRQTNTLTLIAKGTVFDLYINQQFVVQVQDATLTTGIVGVLADDHTGPATMLYTNAKVWDLH